MNISNSAIQSFVTKAVAHTHLDTTDRDAYNTATASASTPVAAVSDSSTQTGTEDNSGYNESFAKMMVNLKAALANTTESVTDDQQAAAAAAAGASSTADKQVAASDSVVKTVDSTIAATGSSTDTSATSSAQEQFMAYMNQSDAEKVRQQLTGVSKEEYDAMTPEQQAAVDKKVSDMQKQKQDTQVAEQDLKTKIAMAKAEMA
jgi:hypothetical protein